jgi:hypothetical protein
MGLFTLYSRDEISLVPQHVGFTNVKFVEYGNSDIRIFAIVIPADSKSD